MNNVGYFSASLSNGGLERNLVHLANHLSKSSTHYHFFLPEKAPYQKLIETTKTSITIIPTHKKYLDFYKAKTYASLFEQKEISTLIFRDPKDLDVLIWAKQFCKKKVNIIYWQAMQLGLPKRGLYHTFKFNQLTKWVASLSSLKEQALGLTQIKKEKLAVIPVGVDIKRFSNINYTQEEARSKLDLPKDEFIVGIIGRIDPQKGQKFVVEQMVHFPTIHLVIIGEATAGEHQEFEKALHQLPSKLGINERVHFKPFLAQSEVFYKAVDVCIMASDAETFGAVTIEALASGTPVLGTNSGGTPEILAHGTLGALYTPHHAESFKGKLTEVINNYDEKIIMAQKAQQRVAQLYEWDSVASSFRHLLQKH